MNGPPDDESGDQSPDSASSSDPDASTSSPDASTSSPDASTSSPDAASSPDASSHQGPTADASRPSDDRDAAETPREIDDPVGDFLPRADVDSRWWYWIAAVPLYVVFGGVLAVFFLGAFLFDLFLTGGALSLLGAFVVFPLVGLAGLVLTIMFPVATYVDARAIAESEAPWSPDPLLWGVVALVTVVASAFTLSLVVALYYLYRRHVAVGTP